MLIVMKMYAPLLTGIYLEEYPMNHLKQAIWPRLLNNTRHTPILATADITILVDLVFPKHHHHIH